MKPTPLDTPFIAEFDTVDERGWHAIVDRFDDANIYQTWTYEAVRHGDKSLSHCVLKSPDGIVAAAQARIVKIPVLGLGAAYMRWAPLWRRCGGQNDQTVFRMAVRAIRNEYVLRRGLFLRIFPVLYDSEHTAFRDILLSEGFIPAAGETPQRTLLLDLQLKEEDIRKNFDQKWRNCLNKAERNELEIIEGNDDALFEKFIGIYRNLLDRKKFKEPNDINEFRRMQQILSDKYKMGIFLSRSKDGSGLSGAICTAIGKTGVYIFGATNDQGMKTNGSYLIQWRVIQWMKKNGCHNYNLNGINPEKNPGTYHFKAGIAGKTGRDVRYLGRFDSYSGSMTAELIHRANETQKAVKRKLSGFRAG